MPRPFEYITGSNSGDGAAVTITVGFTPKSVKWVNTTDRITSEKTDTMDATETIKTIADGTRSLETSSDILFSDTGFVVKLGINVSGKDYDYIVIGPGVN